ncbi:hypothetical protein TWF481_002851 [Arthrobotrys musiformis]|uniref:Uncharacterized protein n=1 Tax=Arthrobotrys musiformis TaxID=47236 RepID=A0AAV9VXJ4_9PEZI
MQRNNVIDREQQAAHHTSRDITLAMSHLQQPRESICSYSYRLLYSSFMAQGTEINHLKTQISQLASDCEYYKQSWKQTDEYNKSISHQGEELKGLKAEVLRLTTERKDLLDEMGRREKDKVSIENAFVNLERQHQDLVQEMKFFEPMYQAYLDGKFQLRKPTSSASTEATSASGSMDSMIDPTLCQHACPEEFEEGGITGHGMKEDE